MDWINDTSLFNELKNGNEETLKSFFDAFYPVYISFAYAYLGDSDECKDIVQESFVQFWESRTTFRNIYTIRAFLYKTIKNKCLNIIRHRDVKTKHMSRIELKEEIGVHSNVFFIENIIREEISNMIYMEVQNLSGMGRQIISLSMEGLSNGEIAERLGISINTVKTHKSRTYQILRGRLNELKMILSLIVLA